MRLRGRKWDMCGRHVYIITILAVNVGYASVCRSYIILYILSPPVPRNEVLKLVQLVFVVLMSAMQDDPANKMFFETNVSILSPFPSSFLPLST